MINQHPCLNFKELTYFSPHHFLWTSVILMIPIFTIILRDLFTLLLSSIYHRELSWLNTFLWFLQKHNFLEYQISIVLLSDPSRDFFCSRWTSTPINIVKLLALGWAFYNSKSFKPKGSASAFRRKVLVTLQALIKAFYLAQWLDLPLAVLLLKILFLAAKTSLLALPLPKVITPLTCHMLLLLLLLCRLFLLSFLWPNT